MSKIYKAEPIKGDFTGKSFISASQLDIKSIQILFDQADKMRLIRTSPKKGIDLLPFHQVDINFKEPSTRTYKSFMSAVQRLGAGTLPETNPHFSSVSKGESFSDDIIANAQYADLMVIRHPRTGALSEAAQISPVPVINAGDGAGEHPTQALLDLYTIYSKLGGVKGKTVTMIGDLKHGRTVKSLAELAAIDTAGDITLNFVAPDELQMLKTNINKLQKLGAKVKLFNDLKEPFSQTDVAYVVRLQRERISTPLGADIGDVLLSKIDKIVAFGTDHQRQNIDIYYRIAIEEMIARLNTLKKGSFEHRKLSADLVAQLYSLPTVEQILTNTSPTDNPYVIDSQVMSWAKPNMILMHPLPRVGEISAEVDSDPRSVYLSDQMQNGLYIRMALIALILGKSVS